MRVLVIDDDIEISKSITLLFNKEGFYADQAFTIKDGFYLASTHNYDCLILDVNLPDGNGMNLCQNLRADGNATPVIFLTVNAAVEQIIRGLNLGADDYLIKPFSHHELLARVRSLIRRYSTKPNQEYRINELVFDPQKRLVTMDNQVIKLTKIESVIFELLIRFQDKPISRDEILEHVYGDEYPLNNSVDVIVNRLRKKIGLKSCPSIISIRSTGYMLSTKD